MSLYAARTTQGTWSIRFGLLDSNGVGIGTPITLEDKTTGDCELAWDGTCFGALWTSWAGALRFALPDTHGALVSATEVVPQTWLARIRLFWDGSGYGLFRGNLLPNLNEVWFARLDLRRYLGGPGGVASAPRAVGRRPW